MNDNKSITVCKRCLMDTSAPNISFDKDGNCSFCTKFLNVTSKVLHLSKEEKTNRLEDLVTRIKTEGKKSKYDCVIGVSGGLDSSYVLIKAKELGLRPLAVHMDNGWNSELAQNNIANLVQGLGVDLYTHVIDWDEYRKLMQAFFDANVMDIELLYDNAMMAVNFQQAARFGIKYILSGVNTATEGMEMPQGWNWFKYDKKNIKAIGKKFANVKLDTFPAIGTLDFVRYKFKNKIQWLSFLDYLEYEKKSALEILESEYRYKPYPYKHYESIFTRFYQGYILPRKFGIDKRKMHLSTLILTNQITREQGAALLAQSPYPSQEQLNEDVVYFLKKMKWTREQLDVYIREPGVEHSEFASEKRLWDGLILGQNNSAIYKIAKGFLKKITSK